jgi:hypothetical protein
VWCDGSPADPNAEQRAAIYRRERADNAEQEHAREQRESWRMGDSLPLEF